MVVVAAAAAVAAAAVVVAAAAAAAAAVVVHWHEELMTFVALGVDPFASSATNIEYHIYTYIDRKEYKVN